MTKVVAVVQVAHHRKKLQGRKLDYDCKKRKQQSGGGIPEKEIKQVIGVPKGKAWPAASGHRLLAGLMSLALWQKS